MKTHELKTSRQHFYQQVTGRKTFEIRRDDRNFKVGDILELKEYDFRTDNNYSSEYSGCKVRVEVTHKLNALELPMGMIADDYCILSTKLINEDEHKRTVKEELDA